ncbi:hypothetical protein FGB62_97g113 [Gracilaria domingensis]|nr:hypothetical protein FGB62_97g113 [Gracilaria domingensis]
MAPNGKVGECNALPRGRERVAGPALTCKAQGDRRRAFVQDEKAFHDHGRRRDSTDGGRIGRRSSWWRPDSTCTVGIKGEWRGEAPERRLSRTDAQASAEILLCIVAR